MKHLTVLFIMFSTILSVVNGQTKTDPLAVFEYYMGKWIPPLDHPMAQNPKLIHLQVIDFEWGASRMLIRSKTGIHSPEYNIPFSEGTITYNPLTEKIIWLEYQYDGDLLFEGEYIALENGGLQRIYTVYYQEGYEAIPNPKEEGWTRLYKETFTPIGTDTIDWKTETFINEKWIKAGSPGGFKAVRKKD
ncbi:hypothetical protein [Ekhidna sp.]|uniref:hypothetical protein n=1 Tax=Ekhidna sp. TaxID=2608089 RepID=UPI0032977D3F